MRGLVILVGVLSVLLVAGAGAVVAKLLARPAVHGAVSAAHTPALTTLDEPPGSRIVSAAAGADGVALVLQGGGPDRVVIVSGGREVGRIALAPADAAPRSLTPPAAGR